MDDNQPTIVITGGAGFIGSALCRFMVLGNHANVINIDKLTYAGNLAALREITDKANYQFYQLDINQSDQLKEIFERHQPSAVFHLAAESHVDRSIHHAEPFIATNYLGTFRLLEVTRTYLTSLNASGKKKFRFIHMSTDEVYGPASPEQSFDETCSLSPSSPYSASKAAADHLIQAWYRTYSLPGIIARCPNNYGPYQHREKLIPKIIQSCNCETTIPIYGTGEQMRDWLHVEDQAAALYQLWQHACVGEIYNISAENYRTNLAVAQTICDLVDQISTSQNTTSCRSLIQHVSDRPGHDSRYAMNPGKFVSHTGWQPKIPFEEGLLKLVSAELNFSKGSTALAKRE